MLRTAAVAVALAVLSAFSLRWLSRWDDAPGPLVVAACGKQLRMRRDGHGVLHAYGEHALDFPCALGYAHAMDRFAQMELVRIVGQGRLSELLLNSPTTVAIDTVMREQAMYADATASIDTTSPETLQFLQSYADGVNDYLDALDAGKPGTKQPLEFLLAGHTPARWGVADTLVTIKLMSYVGLATTNMEADKLLIQAIRSSANLTKLQEVYHPYLDNLDQQLVDLIRRVKLGAPALKEELSQLEGMVPTLRASNNWVVSGTLTESGKPIMSFDPHLEMSRLPSIWSEFTMHFSDSKPDGKHPPLTYITGISMPGVPGIMMGRTNKVAWSFTYGFMDQIDYFIEEIKDQKYRRGDQFLPLKRRVETLHTKAANHKPGETITLAFYDTDVGTIERGSHLQQEPLADGLYLARAWVNFKDGASGNLDSLRGTLYSSTVKSLQAAQDTTTVSVNYLAADYTGQIAYVRGGRAPLRPAHSTGVLPLPAWDTSNHWRGLSHNHTSLFNTEDRFVTANNELYFGEKQRVVGFHMGEYRAHRAHHMLHQLVSGGKHKLSVQDMMTMQCDTFSEQADLLLGALHGLVQQADGSEEAVANQIRRSEAYAILAAWDRRYDPDSTGPPIFESVYDDLMKNIVAVDLFGSANAWQEVSRSPLKSHFFHYLDLYLEKVFQEGPSRVLSVLSNSLSALDAAAKAKPLNNVSPPTAAAERKLTGQWPKWSEQSNMVMTNVFLNGALPAWTGFDHGPVPVAGGRATLVQGQTSILPDGRKAAFGPSYRMVTDLTNDETFTSLPGGPSGHRFSRFYTSEVADFLACKHKHTNVAAWSQP